jgi:hypothetical protein
MAKDASQPPRLEELSDREIERLEARLFCAGGPPPRLSEAQAAQCGGPRPCERDRR